MKRIVLAAALLLSAACNESPTGGDSGAIYFLDHPVVGMEVPTTLEPRGQAPWQSVEVTKEGNLLFKGTSPVEGGALWTFANGLVVSARPLTWRMPAGTDIVVGFSMPTEGVVTVCYSARKEDVPNAAVACFGVTAGATTLTSLPG